MKHRWYKWFGLCAGLIVSAEACMLMSEGPARSNQQTAFAQPAPVAKAADDWPMFGRTLQRNMASPTAKNIPSEWSVEEGKVKNIKWIAELGSKSYGGPIIADGKVFFGTNNANPRDKAVKGQKAVMMCFNEADGKFLWQAVHSVVPGGMGASYGLCSAPCVEGKRHYYVTPLCEVICADNQTGNTTWSYDLMRQEKVTPYDLGNCSPLIVDDLLMIVTSNGFDNAAGKVLAPKAPSFIAFNKNTGKPVWKSNLPGANIIEGQWSNPAIAVIGGKKQVIFPGGDCWLYSFEPATGKLIWKFDCNPKRAPDFNPYIVATPVVYDGRCYVGLGCCPDSGVEDKVRNSYVLCVDASGKGDVSPKSLNAKDPANKGSALVWSYGGPIVPRPKRGRRDYFGRTMLTCAIHDGLLYIAEFPGFIHCLDAKSGAQYWEDDVRAVVWGSPLYADGKVFLGTNDGDLVVYQHGKKLKQLAKIEMGEGIHSTPAVANGVLYVSTFAKLFAIAEKK